MSSKPEASAGSNSNSSILPALFFASRSSDGVDVHAGPIPNTANPVSSFSKDQYKDSRSMAFSKDGSLFAWGSTHSVKVAKCRENFKIIAELPKPSTISIKFSPKGTFIALWQRYVVKVEGQEGEPNVTIWKLSSNSPPELMQSFIAKSFDSWQPQWTDDELLCARLTPNAVHFYDTSDASAASKIVQLSVPHVHNFALSPGAAPYQVTVYVPVVKGAPAFVRMYQYPNFEGPKAIIANKSFYKADSATMTWNALGTAVLVFTSTQMDSSGKSYYGETNLYYISSRGDFDCNVPMTKDGPIYDVQWSPSGRDFVVVSGFSPAKAVLYDSKCNPIFDFGTGPRNFVQYSPQGHIIAIAGFGNLSGQIEFWDRYNFKLVSKCKAPDSTSFEWCADGEHFLTATTAPRLREGNCFKVWHYSGNVVQTQSFKELWQVLWCPLSPNPYPAKPIIAPVDSQNISSSTSVKGGAYIPPHLRGKSTEPLFKLNEVEPPKDLRGITKPGEAGKSSTHESTLDEGEKKLRALKKKLQQIEDLKKLQIEGKSLEKNQLDKINSEETIKTEIEKIKASLR